MLLLAVAFQGITPDTSNLVSTIGFRLLINLVGASYDWDLSQDAIEVISVPAARKASDENARQELAPLEVTPSIRLNVELLEASAASLCFCGSTVQSHDRLPGLGRFRC